MSIKNNHKQFKQWWSKAKNTLKCDEYDAFEIWSASANREGYKLVPIEPSKDMLNSGYRVKHDKIIDLGSIYKAMIGAIE